MFPFQSAVLTCNLEAIADAGQQFTGVEGFDEVVRRPGYQCFDAGVLPRSSGQQNDGNVTQSGVGPPSFSSPKPANPGVDYVANSRSADLPMRSSAAMSVGWQIDFVKAAHLALHVVAQIIVAIGEEDPDRPCEL